MAGGFIKTLQTAYKAAQTTVDEFEAALKEIGAPLSAEAGGATRVRRNRIGKETGAGGTGVTSTAKITMDQIPELVAERFPHGASYEQIRGMAGWKPTAPASNLKRLLVNTGKLNIDPQGLYHAPPTVRRTVAA